jgi:hypothetical protein
MDKKANLMTSGERVLDWSTWRELCGVLPKKLADFSALYKLRGGERSLQRTCLWGEFPANRENNREFSGI